MLIEADDSGSNTLIQRSYASGSVTVVKSNGGDSCVGGFMGRGRTGASGNTSLEDCYALGNVSVNQNSGTVYASGLIGQSLNREVTINRCFSAGSVLVQSSGGAEVYAGGLYGNTWNGDGSSLRPRTDTVFNSAVLCASITVKTSGAKYIGRVYGRCNTEDPTVDQPRAGNNNYALDTMRFEVSNSASAVSFPFWDGTGTAPAVYRTIPSSDDATLKNGQDASDSAFRSQSFWSGLGYTSTVWDLGTPLTSKGYPTLRGVGGAQ